MSLRQRLSAAARADSLDDGPATGTMSLGRTAMVWLAANMVVTTLLTGTLFVPGLPYGRALLVILLGTLVGGSVLVAVGAMGTRTGLPTMVLARASFGRRGGYLPAAFNLVVLMGWSWVQAILAGITVDHVVQQATGFSSPVLFSVLCQAVVVALALFGHAGISRVEPWLAVVMLAVAAVVLVTAFADVGLSGFASLPADPAVMTTAVAFDVVVATAISWTVLSADFNRHARSQRAGVLGTAIGYTASTTIAMALGATALGHVALTGGEAVSFDPTVVVSGFGLPLALVIVVSVMATNTLVVYGMVMSYLGIRPRADFLRVVLVLGATSILGALWQGVLGSFVGFLFLISALFVPVFAIMVVDHYVLRRRRYSVPDLLAERGGAYWSSGGVNPEAIAAFAVGAGLAYYWTSVSPLPVGATVPVFAVTAVLYLGLALGRGPVDGAPRRPVQVGGRA
ncbi:cytosine permease [Quadrisphaera sp. DSM 44207]|uniref:purine-cytosine permease family protein n=1 Tax=Quadrisphaera sp. DSM 44207 TaxID=1881057 RepID=UPI00087E0CB4|nr:cytosine permease [Quadrisphaera sp. DSM 44207]SDQ85421.1 putative hydroxymethylpyrimidine transporter CytX [Quadrisphaera sp. DSM 44207]